MNLFGLQTYSAIPHTLWALAFMAAIGIPAGLLGAGPEWAGAAYGIAFYHGREQRDAENSYKIVGKPMAPWQWPRKSQWDFWPVLVVLAAVAAGAGQFIR